MVGSCGGCVIEPEEFPECRCQHIRCKVDALEYLWVRLGNAWQRKAFCQPHVNEAMQYGATRTPPLEMQCPPKDTAVSCDVAAAGPASVLPVSVSGDVGNAALPPLSPTIFEAPCPIQTETIPIPTALAPVTPPLESPVRTVSPQTSPAIAAAAMAPVQAAKRVRSATVQRPPLMPLSPSEPPAAPVAPLMRRKAVLDGLCCVEGCNTRRIEARGCCVRCYGKLQRAGLLEVVAFPVVLPTARKVQPPTRVPQAEPALRLKRNPVTCAPKCRIEGCNREARARGICKYHKDRLTPEAYQLLALPPRPGGDYTAMKKEKAKYIPVLAPDADVCPNACRALDCDGVPWSRGLCRRCYDAANNAGVLDTVGLPKFAPKPVPEPSTVVVVDLGYLFHTEILTGPGPLDVSVSHLDPFDVPAGQTRSAEDVVVAAQAALDKIGIVAPGCLPDRIACIADLWAEDVRARTQAQTALRKAHEAGARVLDTHVREADGMRARIRELEQQLAAEKARHADYETVRADRDQILTRATEQAAALLAADVRFDQMADKLAVAHDINLRQAANRDGIRGALDRAGIPDVGDLSQRVEAALSLLGEQKTAMLTLISLCNAMDEPINGVLSDRGIDAASRIKELRGAVVAAEDYATKRRNQVVKIVEAFGRPLAGTIDEGVASLLKHAEAVGRYQALEVELGRWLVGYRVEGIEGQPPEWLRERVTPGASTRVAARLLMELVAELERAGAVSAEDGILIASLEQENRSLREKPQIVELHEAKEMAQDLRDAQTDAHEWKMKIRGLMEAMDLPDALTLHEGLKAIGERVRGEIVEPALKIGQATHAPPIVAEREYEGRLVRVTDSEGYGRNARLVIEVGAGRRLLPRAGMRLALSILPEPKPSPEDDTPF